MELSFKIGKKNYLFKAPDNLKDFTGRQWLEWHRALTVPDGKMLFFQIFWNMSVRLVNRLSAQQKADILYVCKQYEQEEVFPSRWLVKTLNGFQGPEDELANLTYGEWMFADSYCEQFLLGDVEAGRKFLGCIYLKRKNGEVFRKELVDKKASRFQRVDYVDMRAIANNWIGCKQAFKERFPHIFSGGDANENKKKNFGWLDVGLSIVEDNPIEFVKLEETSLFLVLKALNNRIESAKEMKERMEQQKRSRK